MSEAELATLSAADRAQCHQLDAQLGAERFGDAYVTARTLTASHPELLALQLKACELGMRFGRDYREITPYCDRASKLASQPAAH